MIKNKSLALIINKLKAKRTFTRANKISYQATHEPRDIKEAVARYTGIIDTYEECIYILEELARNSKEIDDE